MSEHCRAGLSSGSGPQDGLGRWPILQCGLPLHEGPHRDSRTQIEWVDDEVDIEILSARSAQAGWPSAEFVADRAMLISLAIRGATTIEVLDVAHSNGTGLYEHCLDVIYRGHPDPIGLAKAARVLSRPDRATVAADVARLIDLFEDSSTDGMETTG